MKRPKFAARKGRRARQRARRAQRECALQQQLRAEENAAARMAKVEEIALREARIERMCRSKVRYASEQSAEAAALDEGKYHYKCYPPADCGGWHLTSRALDRAPEPRKT